MLHYVRGDGGMAMVPVEELKRWALDRLLPHENTMIGAAIHNGILKRLLAELEAIGK